MNLFTVNNLKVELGGRVVLDIPDLEIPDSSITALTGPNGSGKTTLLLALGGLLDPQRGSVSYRNEDRPSRTLSKREKIRRDLGVVLQSPYLFKTSVLGNVCYGLLRRGIPRSRAASRAREVLELVGLSDLERRPHFELSGGEAQRVALARALVLKPAVLLLDEPFANVDTASRLVIEKVLSEENRGRSTSIIFTTHDLEQAGRLADMTVPLFKGRIHDKVMENLFHGKVINHSDGPVFDTGHIQICIPGGHSKEHIAAIPPESILVSLFPISTSARNSLHGHITSIREHNGTVEIVVKTGELLTARLTRESYMEMGLTLGQEVYLVFKAEAVKLY